MLINTPTPSFPLFVFPDKIFRTFRNTLLEMPLQICDSNRWKPRQHWVVRFCIGK